MTKADSDWLHILLEDYNDDLRWIWNAYERGAILMSEDEASAVKAMIGYEEKTGKKHSIYRHYGTGEGVITADDILRIPDVLTKGERKPVKRGKAQLYEYTLRGEDGTRYTVLTEIDGRRQTFADFYTNKKASPSARKTRSEEARDTDTGDVSGAKLQKDSETEKGIRFFRTPEGEAYGFVKDGKIYIDPRAAPAESRVHEYSHLWAEALRRVKAVYRTGRQHMRGIQRRAARAMFQ